MAKQTSWSPTHLASDFHAAGTCAAAAPDGVGAIVAVSGTNSVAVEAKSAVPAAAAAAAAAGGGGNAVHIAVAAAAKYANCGAAAD